MSSLPPKIPVSRREFLAAAAAAGTAYAIPGCAPEAGKPKPLTPAERSQIEQTGILVTATPDALADYKTRVEISLHSNVKGRAVEKLSLAPLGIVISYRDGSSKEIDLMPEMLRETPEGPMLRTATSMHVQVADPVRDNLKLSLSNPPQSGHQFTVFIDRAGEPGKASRYSKNKPIKLNCEADISGASRLPAAGYTETVLGIDARIGGDNRNIELTVTGLNKDQEQSVREKHAARVPAARVYPTSRNLRLEDDLSINITPVEIRSNEKTPLHFRLENGETISDAIGKLAKPAQSPGHF